MPENNQTNDKIHEILFEKDDITWQTILYELVKSEEIDPEKAFIEKYSVTQREITVLKLVSEGLNNLEIAGKLFVCEETVKMNLKSIFRKLQIRNRTEAAVLAIKAGIRSTTGQEEKNLGGE